MDMTRRVVKINDTTEFTQEQRQAIENTHNIFFNAMFERFNDKIDIERKAKARLQAIIPNLNDFIPDFYNNNDTLILNN
jgi:hypothetical protein